MARLLALFPYMLFVALPSFGMFAVGVLWLALDVFEGNPWPAIAVMFLSFVGAFLDGMRFEMRRNP